MKVVRLYPGAVLKPATRTIVVPAPGTNRMGGAALSGEEVVRWAEVLLQCRRRGCCRLRDRGHHLPQAPLTDGSYLAPIHWTAC